MIKNKIIRALLKVHKKIPYLPFEKQFISIYHKLQNKEGIVIKTINGITYKLDLSELIDNKIYYGNWEPETTEMFKRIIKPGRTIIDVGANIGYYTLLSAKLMDNTGNVISFEPTKECFQRLKKNVGLNKFTNIKLERLALSNKNKKIKTKIRSSWKMSGLKEPIEQEMITMKLDDYLKENRFPKIDFIKIDVDGYEWEVIKGAIKTIKNDKPIICLELGYYEHYNLRELIYHLLLTGYIFHNEKGSRFNTVEEIIDFIPKDGTENFFLFPNSSN